MLPKGPTTARNWARCLYQPEYRVATRYRPPSGVQLDQRALHDAIGLMGIQHEVVVTQIPPTDKRLHLAAMANCYPVSLSRKPIFKRWLGEYRRDAHHIFLRDTYLPDLFSVALWHELQHCKQAEDEQWFQERYHQIQYQNEVKAFESGWQRALANPYEEEAYRNQNKHFKLALALPF